MKGEVIAFPTETTYGLGCDSRDAKAVRKIFLLKQRDRSKPLLLVADTVARAMQVVDLEKMTKEQKFVMKDLTRRYWPGALTLVLPARREVGLAAAVRPRWEVAIRVSSSIEVRKLVREIGFPMVATSANISGKVALRSVRAIAREFASSRVKPDRIVDGGVLPRRKASTVVRIEKDGTLTVIRAGAIRI